MTVRPGGARQYSPESDRTAAKAIGVRLLRELVIPRLAPTAVAAAVA